MIRNSLLNIFLITVATCIFAGCNSTTEEIRTFYSVPLVCETNPQIACGSRIKPFFIGTESEPEIKESWINRQGTAIAIVWAEGISQEEKSSITQPLFKKHQIAANLITNDAQKKLLTESFFSNHAPNQKGIDKWYKGMDVDQLSLEEAASISDSATLFALKAGLINENEGFKIKNEINEYMKTELVKVRTPEELTSDETDLLWKKNGYEIYIKHIGTERAEKVRDYYIDYQKKLIKRDTQNIEKKKATDSEITCPNCGHKKVETMPTDECQLKYTCTKCKKDLLAKQGDCCVFCSYGDHKCPSMQTDKN